MTNLFTLSDWEWSDIFEAHIVAFTADSFGETWNGWATPVVSHRIAEAFVAQMQFLRAAYGEGDHISWDGNGIRVVPSEDHIADETNAIWLLPNEAGQFDLGQLGYTFSRLTDDDRVLRAVA